MQTFTSSLGITCLFSDLFEHNSIYWAVIHSICSQLGSGKVEVSMETVFHSHEDTEKKTSGEKKKGRERGKVN